MVWSDEKDLDVLKEVAVDGVLKQRQKGPRGRMAKSGRQFKFSGLLR